MAAESVVVRVVGVGASYNTILGEPVTLLTEGDESRAQAITQGNVDRPADAPHVVITHCEVGISLKVKEGFLVI
jgi:hypothetical protein